MPLRLIVLLGLIAIAIACKEVSIIDDSRSQLTDLPAITPVVDDVATSNLENLGYWVGHYTFSEVLHSGNHTFVTVIELSIQEQAGEMVAEIDINGTQILHRLEGKVVVLDNQAQIFLTGFRDGHIAAPFSPYETGDLLLTLSLSESGELQTSWGVLQPLGIKEEVSGKEPAQFSRLNTLTIPSLNLVFHTTTRLKLTMASGEMAQVCEADTLLTRFPRCLSIELTSDPSLDLAHLIDWEKVIFPLPLSEETSTFYYQVKEIEVGSGGPEATLTGLLKVFGRFYSIVCHTQVERGDATIGWCLENVSRISHDS